MSDSRQDPPSPQEEAHPDPPSPTLPPRTTTMQNADASSSSSQPVASLPSSSSGGVGDVGVNGSGRQRFYDALRRIGFPRIPALSPRAGAGGASAPPLGSSTTSNDVAGANPSEVPHQAAVPIETVEAVPTSGTPSVDSAPVFGPPPPPSMPAQGQPFVGLDILLDANGGPPPTREEMEALMRSLFGPQVTLPATPQPRPGPPGLPPIMPSIQAIPPLGLFESFGTGDSLPNTSPSAASGQSAGGPPSYPNPQTTPAPTGPDGAGRGFPPANGFPPPPAHGGLGSLINQFISNLAQQHTVANGGHPPRAADGGPMPVVITFSFGSPGQMPPMSDEKTPDPERAKELLGALSRPSHELVERLDHALRMEEEDAGVEDVERTGAQCSVCMDTLVDSPGQSEEVVTLPCSHCFHAECLRPWLETNTNCPTCRFDLDPFSTTLRPHRQTPGRAPAAPTPNSAEAGSIPSATGANAQGRGHPYSRSISRPGTPTAGNARPATQEKKYVLPEGRQTLLERVIHLELAHHIRCSLPLCSHADPELPSPLRRTIPLLVASQPGPLGFTWLACEHRFHPDCLRVACRVRGDREIIDEQGGRLVGCDVKGCHAEGWVEREGWDIADVGDDQETTEDDRTPMPASADKVDVQMDET